MERMNYSRLNMAGLGTTRANSSGIIGRGDPYELSATPCSWRKARLGFGLTEAP